MSSEKEYKENINDIEEIYQIGTLVAVKYETYGLLEESLSSENIGKTLSFADNVKIPAGTVGIIVGGVGGFHTVFYTVLWGGTLGGKKLMITSNKIAKISYNPLDK